MVEIFTGPNCQYCAKAKALRDREGVAYAEYDIARDEHRDEYARRLPRSRSLPQIFTDGVHLGGWEDLELIYERGQLRDRLGLGRGI